jgi:hypothetical protein
MAYPSVQGPYGFLPINLIGGQVFAGSTRNMEIASGYATNIFYGDFVKRVVGGTIEKDVGTTANTPAGVFLGCFYTAANGTPTRSQYYQMAISRAQLLKELLPGLLKCIIRFRICNRYGQEHKEIYETETSERSFEEETKLSGFSAAPVKNEGTAIAYDNAQEAWTARYNHETIALGFSLTEEAIEDNLYDSLSARYTKALARAMAYTKQVKAAAVINNGFSSSYPGGDGVALFSVSHPLFLVV